MGDDPEYLEAVSLNRGSEDGDGKNSSSKVLPENLNAQMISLDLKEDSIVQSSKLSKIS